MNMKPILTPLACILLMNFSAHAASANDFKTSLIAPVRRATCMTTITTTTSALIPFSIRRPHGHLLPDGPATMGGFPAWRC